MMRIVGALALFAAPASSLVARTEKPVDVYALREQVLKSEVVLKTIAKSCKGKNKVANCESRVGDTLFCKLLERSHKDLAAEHCGGGAKAAPVAKEAAPVVAKKETPEPVKKAAAEAPKPVAAKADAKDAAPKTKTAAKAPVLKGAFAALKAKITSTKQFQDNANGLASTLGCNLVKKSTSCANYVKDAAFCLAFAERMSMFSGMEGSKEESDYCSNIDQTMPALSMLQSPTFLQVQSKKAPEDELAKEMTHDLEMNFNKIAPFGKEDTAKELQDHAAKTQDTLVDAVENAEVAEIKRAVFRALTRLRAATIKEFDTIARLETQAIDAYNDAHHYRAENPLAHLHEDEAPVETDKLKSFH